MNLPHLEPTRRIWYTVPKVVSRTRRSGFSLMEIVIAACIFCTVVCSLLTVWSSHATSLARSRNTLVATHLAEQLMETCISQGWDVVPIPASTATNINVVFTMNGQSLTTTFQYSIDVKTIPAPTNPVGLKDVTVTVSWTEQQNQTTNRPKQVQLETLAYWPG